MKTINEEIAELRKRLDELERKQRRDSGGVFVPNVEEIYYTLQADGFIIETTHDEAEEDYGRFAIGNCYPTEEAAEQVVLNRKIHRFLQEQTDFVADWSVPEDKVYLFYDHFEGEWSIEHFTNHQIPSTVYFASCDDIERAAQAAIVKFGLEAFESYLKGSIV